MPGEPSGFRSDDLLDRPAVDVNGLVLGRVVLCRSVGDRLVSFDVALAPRAQERLAAPAASVTLHPRDVIDADDHEVTLNDAGERLVHPERPRLHEI